MKTQNRRHVMIDFEGCGDCPLVLAAVAFDAGQTFGQFSVVIDGRNAAKYAKLQPDMSTFYWWIKQGEEARRGLTADKMHTLDEAIGGFWDYLGGVSNAECGIWLHDIELWAFGGSYDFGMLEKCHDALDKRLPVSFRQFNDCRTVFRQLGGLDLHTIKRAGTYHNALDDCHFQISELQKLNKKLEGIVL